jgi:hypothetical protein
VKKIFGSKKDEVGEIRILHNMDLNDLQNTWIMLSCAMYVNSPGLYCNEEYMECIPNFGVLSALKYALTTWKTKKEVRG